MNTQQEQIWDELFKAVNSWYTTKAQMIAENNLAPTDEVITETLQYLKLWRSFGWQPPEYVVIHGENEISIEFRSNIGCIVYGVRPNKLLSGAKGVAK